MMTRWHLSDLKKAILSVRFLVGLALTTITLWALPIHFQVLQQGEQVGAWNLFFTEFYHNWFLVYVIAILPTIPYAHSYARERNNGSLKRILQEIPLVKYQISRVASNALAGGLVLALPVAATALFLLTQFPVGSASPVEQNLYDALSATTPNPLVQILLFPGVAFLFGATFATIGLAATVLFRSPLYAHIFPFMLYFLSLVALSPHVALWPLHAVQMWLPQSGWFLAIQYVFYWAVSLLVFTRLFRFRDKDLADERGLGSLGWRSRIEEVFRVQGKNSPRVRGEEHQAVRSASRGREYPHTMTGWFLSDLKKAILSVRFVVGLALTTIALWAWPIYFQVLQHGDWTGAWNLFFMHIYVNELIVWVLALLPVIPYAHSYARERNNGSLKKILQEIPLARYQISRVASNALAGGLVLALPVAATVLFLVNQFPVGAGFQDQFFFDRMSAITSDPLVQMLLFPGVAFLFGATFATVGLASTALFHHPNHAFTVPLVLWILLLGLWPIHPGQMWMPAQGVISEFGLLFVTQHVVLWTVSLLVFTRRFRLEDEALADEQTPLERAAPA